MLDRRLNKRRLAASAVLVLAAVVALASVVTAQSFEDELADLQAELTDAFEVLPLSEGWLLQPRDEAAGVQTIELKGSDIAVDGLSVSADELRARFGAAADSILRLNELGTEESFAEAAVERAEAEAEAAAAVDEERHREARAERRRHREAHRSDAQVVVGSNVTIEEDEVARDVVVIGGSLSIHGLVKGDAVAIGGSVEVDGEVNGDVAAIGSSVELESGAHVHGDAVSIGGTVEQASDAIVDGMVQEVPFFPSLRFGGWSGSGTRIKHGPNIDVDFSPTRGAFGFAWEIFGVAMLALFAALTLLIARNPVERVGEQVADEPWKSGLVGLLCQILFFPLLVLLVLILVISIVGIPFLLLLPFAILALVLVGLMGYTAVALRLGRWSEDRFGWRLASPFLALLVGIGLIEVWSLVAELLSMGPGPIKFFAFMFGLFGGLLCYAVWTIGFGGAILSRFGTAKGWSDGGGAAMDAGGWETPLEPSYEVSDSGGAVDDRSGLSAGEPGGPESEGTDGWMDADLGQEPPGDEKP